jgi:hypothetical protein
MLWSRWGAVVGLCVLVGCSSASSPGEIMTGTWQGSGPTNDVFVATQTGDSVSGSVSGNGYTVGSFTGTNIGGQVMLNVIIFEFSTPDGECDSCPSTITGHFVNSRTITGTLSVSPNGVLTLTRK